jgi:hypothetical protein
VRTLKYARFIARTDEIVSLYQETKDQRKQERLAHAYKEIIGRQIEERIAELND